MSSVISRRAGQVLLSLGTAAAVAFFLFLAIGPRLLPYRTVTMLTGSMRPLIPPGAVAVDVAEPVSALRPGQVVSFHAPEPGRPVVTHRVVAVERRHGRVAIRTRGDANAALDPWLAVVEDSTVWRVRAVIPHLGDGIRLLRNPTGHLVAAWLVPGALLVWFLAGLWRGGEGGGPSCGGRPLAARPASSSCAPRHSAARSPGRRRHPPRRPGCRPRRPRSSHHAR